MRPQEEVSQTQQWEPDFVEGWPRLTLGLRRHLARIAPAEAFYQILADGSEEVLEAFLENPKITQAEVLVLIDRARSLYLLEKISRAPRWYASHSVKRRLLANSHTPYRVACRILDYLPLVELQKVMANVNLSREVRNKARECYRKAFMRLSDGETRNILLSSEGRVLRELVVLTPKDKRVLLELLRRPNLPRTLVLALSRSSLTPVEVLELIARRPAWALDAIIRKALLANSKTPQKVKEMLKGRGRRAEDR